MLMFTANQQAQRILYIDSSEYDMSSVYVDVWRCGAGFNVNGHMGWDGVWLSGNALATINVVALRQTRLVPG